MPEAYLEPSRTSTIKLFCNFHKDAPSYADVLLGSKYASAYTYIFDNIFDKGLKVVNYLRKRISSEMFDWVLNTPPIFKLLRENLSKFVSCQNKLLAKSLF